MILATMAAAAANFDPEAATRAYLATLNGAARAKSDGYFEGGYWLLLWGTVIGVAIDLFVLESGLAARFRDWAEHRFKGANGRVWLTALLYMLVSFAIALPWAWYTGFAREHQYGLSTQTLGAWGGDQLKALLIAAILLPLVVMAIFALIRRSPRRWWLWGAGLLSVFVAISMLIAPVFIMPLFNKYAKLPGGPVRERIVAMAHSRGVPADHIYLVDASRQSTRISANVSGLGPTVRISLNDNLLNRTSLPETAAVMGHEMGHYVLNHGPKRVTLTIVIFVILLFAASRFVPWSIRRRGTKWRVRDVADPAALPLYMIAFQLAVLALTPVNNSITRYFENEADAFGLEVAREPDGFAKTAMKLSEYRKIEPSAFEEIVFFDHPSGRTRVSRAMQWKADHLAEAAPAAP